MINKLLNAKINRTYHCSNCNDNIYIEEGISERLTICPKCKGDNILLQSGECNISIGMGTPKTLGMLASKNSERMEKRGELPKGMTTNARRKRR